MGSIVLLPYLHTTTTTTMVNIKLTYFDLRARGEPCRLLLAYGGLKYEDERIPPPWDPASTWGTLKPSTALGQLETKLTTRGGQFFVGNNFTWADLHTFMYVSDLPDKSVLKSFPKIANLVERVGNIPNIKNWVETRPVTTM